MVAPDLNPTAEVVYRWLGQALTAPDGDNGHALAWIVEALTGPLDDVEQVGRGRDGRVGWQIALDPENAPAELLPWLAQWVGETIPPGLSVADRRDRILTPSGWLRGTPAAIRRQIRESLTSSRLVQVNERHEGNPFLVEILIYESQTPDQVALEAEVRATLPAGIDFVITLIVGQTYQEALDKYATYALDIAAYASYEEALTDA